MEPVGSLEDTAEKKEASSSWIWEQGQMAASGKAAQGVTVSLNTKQPLLQLPLSQG